MSPPSLGLVNVDYIRSHLLAEAPWAESHGADHHLYLGAGLLYYAAAYAFASRTIVVLGSGGGFVPRLLRQAQRDVERTRVSHGSTSSSSSSTTNFELYLIDAHMPSAGWGATFYAENYQTVMRRDFADLHYMIQTTDEAFEVLKAKPNFEIDYLHIDADHSMEQSYQDFVNYASLLSPTGIVSFHDTCRNKTRYCDATGVPAALEKIKAQHGERWQFLDAHYLYRGIALAIPKVAPAIGNDPRGLRWKFCRNNAPALHKRSEGFTKTDTSLGSLGDFFNCSAVYNLTLLGQHCPQGFRWSLSQKDHCLRCIPGLKGDNCTAFRYQAKRKNNNVRTSEMFLSRQTQRLVAAWLADYNAQHLLEFNAVPIAQKLYHAIQSAVAVDPRLQPRPLWTDEGETPILRYLPVEPVDILAGGDYAATVQQVLAQTDAVVCVDCALYFPEPQELGRILTQQFPLVRAVVLDAPVIQETSVWWDKSNAMFLQLGQWTQETDVIMGSNPSAVDQAEKGHPEATLRRLVFMVKKNQYILPG